MASMTALFKKDARALRNFWRVFRGQSLFKVGFILLFAVGMLVGLFALFFDGFEFLATFGGAGYMITRRLFALFYFGLGIMLVMSGIVTSYSTLFRSREVPFLLVGPFDMASIVTYKFIETTLLSSWAFFFIILPFAGAYAWHEKLGLQFGLWTCVFTMPFLVICSGIGVLITLVIVRWLPRLRGIGWLLFAGLAIGGYILLVRAGSQRAFDSPVLLLSRMVPGIRAASLPLMPSWWAAEGIKACSNHDWGRGLLLLGTITSNALMMAVVVQTMGRAFFYEAFQRVRGARGTVIRKPVLFAGLSRVIGWVCPRNVRALILKDIRTFFRDPMQWSQALIFFGLLAFYFSSLRSFHYEQLRGEWRNMIAFLNVFSVAAVQCSLASRFVYPQLSLEGQAFWMLGLSPTTVRRILLSKFVLAAAAMLAVSTGLILLSTHMLNADPLVRIVALSIMASVSITLAGLSTGLGAVFLDLKTANPAAIVSGFGGTVNLVLSLAFMLAAILPFGVIFHLLFRGRIPPRALSAALRYGFAWLLISTPAATAIPLWFGHRALRARDY